MISTIAAWALVSLVGLVVLAVLGTAIGRHLGRANARMDRIFREELDNPRRDTTEDQP